MEVEFEEQKQHPLVVTDEWNSKQHPLMVTDDWKSKQHPLVVNDEWRSRGTVIECNSYMLHSKIACDVCFRLGSQGREVVAHKFVLISRSPVFYAMFYGPVADNSGVVTVPDIDPEIFEMFLRLVGSIL